MNAGFIAGEEVGEVTSRPYRRRSYVPATILKVEPEACCVAATGACGEAIFQHDEIVVLSM